MHWMWGLIGVAAACIAVVIIRLWNRHSDQQNWGEVSTMAEIQRSFRFEDGRPAVEFADKDGRLYEFAVPPTLAPELEPGLRGVLTYRGSEFVYFIQREDFAPGESCAAS